MVSSSYLVGLFCVLAQVLAIAAAPAHKKILNADKSREDLSWWEVQIKNVANEVASAVIAAFMMILAFAFAASAPGIRTEIEVAPVSEVPQVIK